MKEGEKGEEGEQQAWAAEEQVILLATIDVARKKDDEEDEEEEGDDDDPDIDEDKYLAEINKERKVSISFKWVTSRTGKFL